MKTYFKAVLVTTALFVFISCAAQRTSSSNATGKVTIGQDDNGKEFTLSLNKKFTATFNECRGCADIWRFSDIDSTVIGFVSKRYSKPSCTGCVGGNHDVSFNFKTLHKGRSALTFNYFKQKVSVIIIVE